MQVATRPSQHPNRAPTTLQHAPTRPNTPPISTNERMKQKDRPIGIQIIAPVPRAYTGCPTVHGPSMRPRGLPTRSRAISRDHRGMLGHRQRRSALKGTTQQSAPCQPHRENIITLTNHDKGTSTTVPNPRGGARCRPYDSLTQRCDGLLAALGPAFSTLSSTTLFAADLELSKLIVQAIPKSLEFLHPIWPTPKVLHT